MGIRKIPEQIITTCDKCGKDFKEVSHRLNGKLSYSCDGLDYSGHAVGLEDNYKYIFCDQCYREFDKAIQYFMYQGASND